MVKINSSNKRLYQISSKACALFSSLRCPSPEFPSPTPSLRWLLQDGAEECVGHGFVTHRGGHQRFAASLRRLDRRLDVCIAVDLWSSGHHQTGRKLGKWPCFPWRCGSYYEFLLFLLIFVDLSLMIYMTMVIIVVYFSGNCSWFSPYFGMLEPCWAQRAAGIGDTRMLYT